MTIDLRSDTVTRPTPKMRQAMAEAPVGDDGFGEDPTVNRLEARAAEIFGREAALFTPSGSMANLLAVLAQTERGNEIICDRRAHMIEHEMAALSAIAGVMPRPVDSDAGVLSWASIERAVRPRMDWSAWTGLITIENTHNFGGGTVTPTDVARAICAQAHARSIPVHLDGARVFNAAVALGESVRDMTSCFDSVAFCLSKGLGAPVGAMLVGGRELIRKARRARRMLGGGMRQAGVLAAAGLVALEESPARLSEDHENARHLAAGIGVDPVSVQTNIVLLEVGDAYTAFGRLAAEGVLTLPISPTTIRMVTHQDVDRTGIEWAIAAVRALA
jgi:threonine aldolase